MVSQSEVPRLRRAAVQKHGPKNVAVATTAKQNTSASRDRHIFQPKVKTKNIASTWKDATKMGLSKDFRFHNKAISLELERIMTTHTCDVTQSQDVKWRHNFVSLSPCCCWGARAKNLSWIETKQREGCKRGDELVVKRPQSKRQKKKRFEFEYNASATKHCETWQPKIIGSRGGKTKKHWPWAWLELIRPLQCWRHHHRALQRKQNTSTRSDVERSKFCEHL